MPENRQCMAEMPDAQEKLALVEIEERLRRVRARFSLYTLQHGSYRMGSLLLLSAALLIFLTFVASPLVFTLSFWSLFVALVLFFFLLVRRGAWRWTSLMEAARRVDARAALEERLSTLLAYLLTPPREAQRSRLWSYLVADNIELFPTWEVKKVAPRRVPWSVIPFLASLLLLLVIASIPALSPHSAPSPFSLENLTTLLPQLPERLQQLYEEKMSFIPEVPGNWGGEGFFVEGEEGTGMVSGVQEEASSGGKEIRNLASLPEELRKLIREALRGLPEKDRLAQGRAGRGLSPGEEEGEPKSFVQVPKLPEGQKRVASLAPQEHGKESKGQETLAKGSGIQRLGRVRLGRKPARGKFQPEGPVVPGRGGGAGGGGPGAGSGTDPRLFGGKAAPGTGASTFLLALDASRSGGGGVESGEGEAGAMEKAGGSLSWRQSLDDAIRKAQVPPEYEEIVKRLFSRRIRSEQ